MVMPRSGDSQRVTQGTQAFPCPGFRGFGGGAIFFNIQIRFASPFYPLFAPRGTPAAIIDTVNRAVVASLADPKVRERLEAQGMDVAPREKPTPESLAAIQRSEIAKWWPIIEQAGIKAQ